MLRDPAQLAALLNLADSRLVERWAGRRLVAWRIEWTEGRLRFVPEPLTGLDVLRAERALVLGARGAWW